MNIIISTMRSDIDPKYNEKRDQIDRRLVKFFNHINYSLLFLPNHDFHTKELNKILKSIKIKGFLLPGGENIKKNPIRDKLELKILNFCKKKGLPILGICRGMQVINYWAKGDKLKKKDNHVKKIHKLNGKLSHKVNSYHSLCITKCPNNFEKIAESNDGIIEAMKHKKYPIFGIMWHPERNKNFNENDKIFIKNIFNQ